MARRHRGRDSPGSRRRGRGARVTPIPTVLERVILDGLNAARRDYDRPGAVGQAHDPALGESDASDDETLPEAVAARVARGWNGTQTSLPLAETLDRLNLRRRRAQIAARHALELR